MASGSSKYFAVVSDNSVRFDHQFDLDDVLTMPENPQARQRAVACLVSEMPVVNYATGSCRICMEWFGQSDQGTARRVSCGHVYHHNCLSDWLLNGNSDSCPLCRHEISS